MSSPSLPSQTPAGNERDDVSDKEGQDPGSSIGERKVGGSKSVGIFECIRGFRDRD